MFRLLAVLISVTDGLSCKLMMPLLRTVGVKSRPTPNCFHSIEMFGVKVAPIPSARWWRLFPVRPVREFAAGEERRLFSRERDEIRFSQTLDEALALERRQEHVDAHAMRVDDVGEQNPKR